VSSRSLKLCVFAIPSFAWRSLTGCAVDGSSSTTGPGNDAGDFIGVTPHDSGGRCRAVRAHEHGTRPAEATLVRGKHQGGRR
jgi:hypothetical protein